MGSASRRVFEVFTAACTYPHSARGGFVDEACRDEAETRDEVFRLLRMHEETQSGTPSAFGEQMRAAVGGGMRGTFEPAAGHPDRIDAFQR